MHFQELKVAIDVLYQSQTLHHQVHCPDTPAVRGPYPFSHLVMNVAGSEHRSGLSLPVFGLQPLLDSALAVTNNFAIGSIHSKWPFCGCYVRSRTCFSPHKDGHFELFVQTKKEFRAYSRSRTPQGVPGSPPAALAHRVGISNALRQAGRPAR